jgi:hypothetical protein
MITDVFGNVFSASENLEKDMNIRDDEADKFNYDKIEDSNINRVKNYKFKIWTYLDPKLKNWDKSLFNILIFCPRLINQFCYCKW